MRPEADALLIPRLIEEQNFAEVAKQLTSLSIDEITPQLLEKVVDSTVQTGDPTLSELVVSELISRKQIKLAVQLFHKLTKHKVVVSQPLYVSLIQALAGQNDIDGAVMAYYHLKDSGQNIRVETYAGIVDAYTNVGDMINAKRVFDEMYKCGFNADVRTYISMINGYAKRNNSSGISGIYNLLRVDVHVEPDYELYQALLRAYGQIGDLNMVFRLWDGILVSNITIDGPLVKTIFQICGRYGALARAQAVWRKLHIASFQFDSETYTAYMVALIENGFSQPALELLLSMKQVNLELDDKCASSISAAFGEESSKEKEHFLQTVIEQFPHLTMGSFNAHA
ncbi:hypothetical protein K493DRAFT_301086 [Basidiobolus meristosporus CBS 931.73]|uniref:Pentacotripeptide-repeat region of PRORP domain-containing protein n=1 Tax=Basidiobolus meristosporus CBS 931.73 TaxID=1314790 RepID=A0A1Y1YDR8_9FUNG|nr:hypothetical protein K493DRAFT_301086 [Basidiobolus meristosporus CBS 931.73]|eukprot:ORX96142.1 hypothetical protein K493DRAFT_301086 [Basidiobolus meristosporus CBS 931.73]